MSPDLPERIQRQLLSRCGHNPDLLTWYANFLLLWSCFDFRYCGTHAGWRTFQDLAATLAGIPSFYPAIQDDWEYFRDRYTDENRLTALLGHPRPTSGMSEGWGGDIAQIIYEMVAGRLLTDEKRILALLCILLRLRNHSVHGTKWGWLATEEDQTPNWIHASSVLCTIFELYYK